MLESITLKDEQGDETTRYEYTGTSDYVGTGFVKRVIRANGSSIEYDYDSNHRIVAKTNDLGERIEYTLDLEGNAVASVTRNTQGTILRSERHVFDELSRVQSSIGANGQTLAYEYDKAGNRVKATDALNNTTAYAYDALNRLQSVTDANDGVTQNAYDAQDRLTAFTDQRGLRTEYRYDGFGRKVAQISPDTGETKYRYDLANNLIEQKDARGEITRHEYDALNRVLATRYPTAENDEPQADIVYSYDNPASEYGIGRLSTVTDTTGETRYHYNHRGQVAQQLTIVDGVEYATAYNYNAQGQLASMVYPSGREVTYALNKL